MDSVVCVQCVVSSVYSAEAGTHFAQRQRLVDEYNFSEFHQLSFGRYGMLDYLPLLIHLSYKMRMHFASRRRTLAYKLFHHVRCNDCR